MTEGTKKMTRAAIISTARSLFTEKGYEGIGMRDIAEVLSISVGNLTYHFKKKEDLLEAVIMEYNSEYKPFLPCKTLEEVNEMLLHYEQIREENLFYFSNYTQLSKISEKICAMQRKIYLDQAETWRKTFSELFRAGLVRQEDFEGQFEELANSIHFMKVHWDLRQEAERRMNFPISRFQDAAWRLLFPCLTEEGRKIYGRLSVNLPDESRSKGKERNL